MKKKKLQLLIKETESAIQADKIKLLQHQKYFAKLFSKKNLLASSLLFSSIIGWQLGKKTQLKDDIKKVNLLVNILFSLFLKSILH